MWTSFISRSSASEFCVELLEEQLSLVINWKFSAESQFEIKPGQTEICYTTCERGKTRLVSSH